MRRKDSENRVSKSCVLKQRSLYEQKDGDEYESSSMAKLVENMRRPCLF